MKADLKTDLSMGLDVSNSETRIHTKENTVWDASLVKEPINGPTAQFIRVSS